MTSQFSTENGVAKPGIFSRLWSTKQTETMMVPVAFVPQQLPAVATGKCAKQSENVPAPTKVSEQKLKPGIGVLRLHLMDGARKTVGELAAELGLSAVQASRLISRAEEAGHVRKQKAGRFVFVTAISIEERKATQRRKAQKPKNNRR